MGENIFSWIMGVAVAQGAFLCIALATLKVRNSNARWLLTAILLVLTLTLGEEFLDVIDYPFWLGIGLIADFMLWPMIYLLVASLAEDDPRPLRAHWRHFVPAVFSLAWLLSIHIGAEDQWVSLSNPAVRQQIALIVLVKALYFVGYAWATLRRPLVLSAKPAASRRALRWVRRWLWFVCGAYLLGMLSFLAFYLEFDWAVDSDIIGAAMLVVLIYSLGYFSIANRNVFDVRSGRPVSRERAGGDILARAGNYLAESKAYLDPDLSLRGLADALELNETRFSQALNEAMDGGFYTLINKLRLDACIKLLDDHDNDERTVLDIAYESGFSSKATFYRYFRARKGMTPKSYRAQG